MIAAEFTTSRLRMLPLQVEHSEEMAAVLADPELYRFTGGEPPTVDELASRYKRQLAGPGEAGTSWLNWVISSADGLVGYLQSTVTDGEAEVAWVIGAPHQGKGYAKEAALGLADWLRSQGIRRLVAHIHPDHAASAAVAAALGLTRTDVMDDGEYLWRGQ